MFRFWRTTPLDLGRDLSSVSGGERSIDPSTVIGLWTSGSDRGESRAAEGYCSESEPEESGSSVHHVDSAGADNISDDSGWNQSYWPIARRAMSGMVGRTKGEPSRVGYIVWVGGGGTKGGMTKRG